jgi:Flp pilus assembly protein TadD
VDKDVDVRLLSSATSDGKRIYQRSLTLLMLERWDEVESVATEALERQPRDDMMLVSLGAAQLRLGKATEARATFEKALDLGRSPRTYSAIAWALAEADSDLDTAERYAESAVMQVEAEVRLLSSLRSWRRYFSLQTELAHYLTGLGWARFKNGKIEQAESTLLAALELLPHPRVAWHLAELNAAANDVDAAAKWLARAHHLAGGRAVLGRPSEALKRIRAERAGETPQEVAAWVNERRVDYARSLELEPASGEWLWPAGAEPSGTQYVDLMLLVDEEGAVEDAVTVSGSPPWAERALADAPRLRFRAVQWDDRSIRHLRPVRFSYQRGLIAARHWILGEQMPVVLAFMTDRPLD